MSPAMNRFGGWALVIGPLLALGFFLIEPGGLLIDRADTTDAVAAITAKASNTELTHLTSLVVPFGLALLLFGFIVLQAGAIREGGGIGAALLAVLLMGLGTSRLLKNSEVYSGLKAARRKAPTHLSVLHQRL